MAPFTGDIVRRGATWAATRLYVASLRPAWRRFSRASRAPERAQATRLRALLAANAKSGFGRAYGFDRLDSVEAYRRRVPVQRYFDLEPWIERVAKGEPAVLTCEPVRMMEQTAGSTHARKLVPYTDSLLAELAAATGPWIFDLHRRCPGLIGTRAYWSISPAARRERRTEGGIRIGFDDDTEYFGPLARWALGATMAAPGTLAKITDLDLWRRRTAEHLLAADDLGLISVWSPTFLTHLMDYIATNLGELARTLPEQRAEQVLRAGDGAGTRAGLGASPASAPVGSGLGRRLWPRLVLVSCWTDGSAARFVPALLRYFPGIELQGKGLLSTEGVVSFPLWGQPGAVLAVASHFLEFIEVDHPARQPVLASELRVGGEYSPVLTTGGGLYRYHLEDIVRCVGVWRSTPLVRFVGRLDGASDLAGEKLGSRLADEAISLAQQTCGLELRFAVLAPAFSPAPHYRLFVDGDADPAALESLARAVDAHLSTSHPYRHCRALGQLGPVEPLRVESGWARYEAAMVAAGRRAGELKPPALDTAGIASKAFGVADGLEREERRA